MDIENLNGMSRRRRLVGEAQHKIAAAFDVNQGRISEILSGKRFPAAKRLAQNPPQTPARRRDEFERDIIL